MIGFSINSWFAFKPSDVLFRTEHIIHPECVWKVLWFTNKQQMKWFVRMNVKEAICYFRESGIVNILALLVTVQHALVSSVKLEESLIPWYLQSDLLQQNFKWVAQTEWRETDLHETWCGNWAPPGCFISIKLLKSLYFAELLLLGGKETSLLPKVFTNPILGFFFFVFSCDHAFYSVSWFH